MARVLGYLFPFILIAIEYCLRIALQTDLTAFAGPALASASAGLLIPMTAPKPPRMPVLAEDVRRELERLNFSVRSNRDELYRALALLLLLLSITAWVFCVVLSEKKDPVSWFGISRSLLIGLGSYIVAIIASELKEAQ